MLRNRGRLGRGFRSFFGGKRSLSGAASQTDDDFFFAKKFVLAWYSLFMAFKDLLSLYLISHDDGLIDGGKFIVLYIFTTCDSIVEAFSLSRSFCFCFEVKSKYRSRTALYLQLPGYSKFRLLKRIQCCCNVLPYLSSLKAPHNQIHPVPESTENSCLY